MRQLRNAWIKSKIMTRIIIEITLTTKKIDYIYRVILKFLYHFKIRIKIQKTNQKNICFHQKMRLLLKFFSVIFKMFLVKFKIF
jgi:hypothetical protein